MKKILTLAILGLILSGCSKGFDMPEQTPNPPDPAPGITDEDIKNHAESVLGFTIPANQDWNTTTTGTITFNINSSVKKVAVLVLIALVDEEGESYNTMRVLNQAETDNKTSLTLNYDAPSKNEGLYAAFYTENDCMYQKIEGNTVSFNQAPAKARAVTRTVSAPSGTFAIGKEETSFAADRGWLPGDKLYMLADEDYERMKIKAEPYSDEYSALVRDLVFAYLPNTKTENNLIQIMAAGYSDDDAYRITTGEDGPIVISPIYKQDGADKYGNEVYNSDLYYYYFNPADMPSSADAQVAFLQSLPKYKLIPFNLCFGANEDNVLDKRTSFAALYFGDSKTPAVGTEGTFKFPKGYKIGFMVRAKTTTEAPKKQGELYFDGRLNTKINAWPNFNKLNPTDPRATWLNINHRSLMCWESGTDRDFNDILLEVEGSVEPIHTSHEFEYNTYTFCFEDRKMGDYDLNDVVIKAKRLNATTVEYSIVACGANDELYVMNIGKDAEEVHALFGKGRNQFVNTESQNCEPIKVTKTVSSSFSFLNDSDRPYIVDKTETNTVKVAAKGKDPHGIMIPFDFAYPKERVCIKDAYSKFNDWGSNPVNSTNWYTKPVNGKVFTK